MLSGSSAYSPFHSRIFINFFFYFVGCSITTFFNAHSESSDCRELVLCHNAVIVPRQTFIIFCMILDWQCIYFSFYSRMHNSRPVITCSVEQENGKKSEFRFRFRSVSGNFCYSVKFQQIVLSQELNLNLLFVTLTPLLCIVDTRQLRSENSNLKLSQCKCKDDKKI